VPNKVPVFATHQCGVGGLVLDASGQRVLVVKERISNARWKFPGGLTDLGEDLDAAAVREVREETGVRTQFLSILTVRQQHDVQFGRSDLYFTCLLKALSEEIIVDSEIQAARWMPVAELRAECTFPTVISALDIVMRGQLDGAAAESALGLARHEFSFTDRRAYRIYMPPGIWSTPK
jgi:ADP-ribose pyrophosphatase YjhB (NUDIX family)